jgi:hypothetical protein
MCNVVVGKESSCELSADEGVYEGTIGIPGYAMSSITIISVLAQAAAIVVLAL